MRNQNSVTNSHWLWQKLLSIICKYPFSEFRSYVVWFEVWCLWGCTQHLIWSGSHEPLQVTLSQRFVMTRPMTFCEEKTQKHCNFRKSKKKCFFGIGCNRKMWTDCWLYCFFSNFRKTQRTNTFLSSKISFLQGSLAHTPWTCNIAWHSKNQSWVGKLFVKPW